MDRDNIMLQSVYENHKLLLDEFKKELEHKDTSEKIRNEIKLFIKNLQILMNDSCRKSKYNQHFVRFGGIYYVLNHQKIIENEGFDKNAFVVSPNCTQYWENHARKKIFGCDRKNGE